MCVCVGGGGLRGGGYLIIICCNEQPSQATANPVGGKACLSTKGGLLRYILNTYSIYKVSSLKFAYYKHSICRSYVAPTYFSKGGFPVTFSLWLFKEEHLSDSGERNMYIQYW